jgi:AcrR family transcriptional regulator
MPRKTKGAKPPRRRPGRVGPTHPSTFETSPHVLAPQQKRSRAALAKIVTAAGEILRDEGIEGLAMAAVSERAGIPVGNIYRRFRSKDDLILAIKRDVSDRIELAVMERLSAHKFNDLFSLVRGFADALTRVFSQDENLHKVLFAPSVDGANLASVGSGTRRRIFERYRESLVPLLSSLGPARASMVVDVSFQIVVMAVVGKARANDNVLARLPWTTLGREFALAAIAYIEAALGS